MLSTFRHASQNIIVKALLGLIVLAFIIWGVGDVLRSAGSSNNIATVGSRAVSLQSFDRAFRNQFNSLPNANRADIAYSLLNTMVNRELLLAYAEDQGLDVGNQAITNQIKHYPPFLNEEGVFDYDIFTTRLKGAGITEEQYFDDQRNEMLTNFILTSLRSSLYVPEKMAEDLYYTRNEERTVSLLMVPKDHAKNVAEPTEAELVDFYENKRAEFSAPEYRSFHYAVANCTTMQPLAPVSDTDLEAAYNERKEQGLYDKPETRDVKQLFFIDQAKAEAAYEPISKGGSFADAFAMMDDSQKNMDLDIKDAERNALPASLANVIFSLEEGGISKPVEGPLGWHIFKVEKITPGGSREFADVKENLRKELDAQSTCKKVQDDFIAMEDGFAGGNALLDVAKDYPYLTVLSLNDVAQDGSGQNGQIAADLPDYTATDSDGKTNLLKQVFAAEAGGDAFTFAPDQNIYVAVQVSKSTPPRERALDEIKGLVITAWHKQKQAEESKRLAETAAKHIGEGKTMEDIANAMGLKVEERTVDRPVPGYIADANNLPVALRNDVFATALGGVTPVYDDAKKNAFYVAQVKSLVKADPADAPASLPRVAALKNQLQDEMFDDLLKQFTKALGDRYKVEIHTKLLEQYIKG
jgi:peptidyl-prolyl cis-trans isomerase D